MTSSTGTTDVTTGNISPLLPPINYTISPLLPPINNTSTSTPTSSTSTSTDTNTNTNKNSAPDLSTNRINKLG